ncbi:MAG: hypothetical protein AUJ51_09740 [Elusimicrobia bacterium CG1_02_56_21]|nr:MAG: hypothetical protein AUJ51_09740 [Elusimicrobia bacterium CG1_02_56_21]
MDHPLRVLIVEDVPTDYELAQREVGRVLPDSEFLRVETRGDFLTALKSFSPGLIISDYKLPQFDGLSALKLALGHAPGIPFIILTGSMNEDTAVECMKAGAWDYVIKEHIKRLGPAAVSALEQGRVRGEKLLAEQALRKSEALLLEKNQEMESFLYITTHDLRSPLVNIQGFSQNLERHTRELREILTQTPLPEETKTKLQKIAGESIPVALKFVLDSAYKMDALITALLKVSRIGRLEMKPETLEMKNVFAAVLDSLRFQLDEAGGSINTGPLPQCRADQGAVSRIFTNLLDNAIKYRSKDRPLTITMAGEVSGDKVLYSVSDNGSGIPEKDLHRISDIFHQPVIAAGKKGEGIGLAIVRRLLEKNGGRLRVESKEREGSVFHVELPSAAGEKGAL